MNAPRDRQADRTALDSRLAWALTLLLAVGLGLAVALLIAGVVLTLARPGVAVARESSVADLPRALGALEPGGFFDLGLMVLLATPAVRVVAQVVAFGRHRQWVFAGAGVLVLCVLVLSGYLGLRTG